MANTVDRQQSLLLFQSQVEYQKKPVTLTLTKSQLSWDSPSRGHDVTIDLREVIAVQPLKVPLKPSLGLRRKLTNVRKDQPVCIELQPLEPIGFSVYVVSRAAGHRWKSQQLSFQCKDCQQWISRIREVLRSPGFNRPKKLIVFVNPFAGKRKAVKVYQEKVQPLFELAEIDVTVIETTRANHARDDIEGNLDLRQYDGLVCVGGDGMFSELLNGLVNRTLKDAGMAQTPDHTPVQPQLRIGIIPAGSTDTIVYTTTGINDPVTSALHIIIGDSTGIDVNSINVDGEFDRYSVTLMAYGYMGDLLKDSENNRWMGPKRYDWSGTKAFLANRSYEGEVTFELSPDSPSNLTEQNSKCYSGCTTCSLSGNKLDVDTTSLDSTDVVSAGRDIERDGDGGSSYVQKIRGDFVAINGVTMSCCCDMSPTGMSPSCHLGDGCLDLILISNCSRFKFLRWLLSVAKGERTNFSHVQMYRVRRFSFRPLADDRDEEDAVVTVRHNRKHQKLKTSPVRNSVWNCDGEVIHDPVVDVRVHGQLIKLFARGIEDLDRVESHCNCCVSSEQL